jgi:FkbM family methyltransferase
LRAEVSFEGATSVFHVQDELDVIQGEHAAGRFYELHQLLAHRNLIPAGCTVLDCGANVGNHTIFYARHTRAKRVYPFEPNPRASKLLDGNIESNPEVRSAIDTSHIGIALSVTHENVGIVSTAKHNLGATRFGPDDRGALTYPLDELHFEGPIGFIKIDVEGMEMDVLYGAEKLLKKHRPAIAIEVDPANEAKFWEWSRRHRYVPVGAFLDYIHVRNYLMIPTY